MPIRFRCRYCSKLLGIGRRKAGTDTACPHCGKTITVPQVEDTTDAEHEWDDLDRILKPNEALPPSSASADSAGANVEVGVPLHPVVGQARDAERALFEEDIDAILGQLTESPARKNRTSSVAVPTTGQEIMSLDDHPGELVLSSGRMRGMLLVMGLLLMLSFLAGFWMASAR